MTQFVHAYHFIHEKVCGKHPDIYPWHPQWLATIYLYKDLRSILQEHGGNILDVGCGEKPYKDWFAWIEQYTGIDIMDGPAVDQIITANNPWPLQDSSFDTVLCSQVFEHMENLDLSIEEISRVIKPGGILIITVPFIYNEHGNPLDFRRLSCFGLKNLVGHKYDIIDIRKEGGIGSTICVLFLNWVALSLDKNKPARILKAVGFPALLVISFVVNMAGYFVDKLDLTGAFYSNVFLVARKK